jgi:callose synthase
MQRSDIRRLQHLLKGDGSESIPKNLEARRRLEFFANSLFMNMPQAKDVKNMMSFR